jgi:hypothetical protein
VHTEGRWFQEGIATTGNRVCPAEESFPEDDSKNNHRFEDFAITNVVSGIFTSEEVDNFVTCRRRAMPLPAPTWNSKHFVNDEKIRPLFHGPRHSILLRNSQ